MNDKLEKLNQEIEKGEKKLRSILSLRISSGAI